MKFLLGGRLGDLVHALYVAKNTEGKHDLYITDQRNLHSDGFMLPLEDTYKELLPIISTQDYCNSFQIYNDETFDENLSMWRRYAYSASWTQLLSNTFGVPVNGDPWIKVDKLDNWQNKIVVHASDNQVRRGYNWEMVLNMYEYRTVFVGNENEYYSFGFTIPFYKPESLIEHFQIINSCKFFIGNQSAPLAIAHSLGVPRLAMLNEGDKLHYVGEEKFHKDFYWIAQHEHFFEGINY